MTYREACTAMRLCLSFTQFSRNHVEHWNAIEDALNALPFADYAEIVKKARAASTREACALLCICD
jgi:hypothetical protein